MKRWAQMLQVRQRKIAELNEEILDVFRKRGDEILKDVLCDVQIDHIREDVVIKRIEEYFAGFDLSYNGYYVFDLLKTKQLIFTVREQATYLNKETFVRLTDRGKEWSGK